MAFEAVVYPHEDPLISNYGYKLDCNNWAYDRAFLEFLENNNHSTNYIVPPANWDSSSSSSPNNFMQQNCQDHPNTSSPGNNCTAVADQSLLIHAGTEPPVTTITAGRRKRRRTKSTKNKDEIENQRMTHIAVERNRRKQMNEYLAVLRSLMPASYVQRGDQASIIGGTINFVKELEQLLQTMEAQKKTKQQPDDDHHSGDGGHGGFSSSPFADFFSFPQYYSTRNPVTGDDQNPTEWATADIEVTMVESHANLKIVSKKRPRQLLKMVAGFQGLRLTILHVNVTTVDQMVLYSVSVKVEEGCHLNTVDEMAAAVNQMLHRIHEEESAFS